MALKASSNITASLAAASGIMPTAFNALQMPAVRRDPATSVNARAFFHRLMTWGPDPTNGGPRSPGL